MVKSCKSCQEDKQLDGFYPYAKGRDGTTARCRRCIVAAQSKRAERNKSFNLARPEARPEKKRCTRCLEVKPRSYFCQNIRRHDGLNPYCRPCYTASKRHVVRKKTYGLTDADFRVLLASQGGVCGVCAGPVVEGRSMHVDHCHATGAVRGILCGNCNRGLGCFHDSPGKLAAAIEYLVRTKDGAK